MAYINKILRNPNFPSFVFCAWFIMLLMYRSMSFFLWVVLSYLDMHFRLHFPLWVYWFFHLWCCLLKSLWLHRRFLSLLWMKHLAVDDQSSMFVKDEMMLFQSCIIIPDNEFGDHQAQATFSATYITWLAKVGWFPYYFSYQLFSPLASHTLTPTHLFPFV